MPVTSHIALTPETGCKRNVTLVGSIKIFSGNFPGIARKVIFFFFAFPPEAVDHVKVKTAWAQLYHSIEEASLNSRLIQE